jgi:hypothetical protein
MITPVIEFLTGSEALLGVAYYTYPEGYPGYNVMYTDANVLLALYPQDNMIPHLGENLQMDLMSTILRDVNTSLSSLNAQTLSGFTVNPEVTNDWIRLLDLMMSRLTDIDNAVEYKLEELQEGLYGNNVGIVTASNNLAHEYEVFRGHQDLLRNFLENE